MWSVFLTLFLSVMQIIGLGQSNFLGVDSNSFAFEILRYYPLIAVGELVKVLSVFFLPLFFVTFIIFSIKSLRARFLLSIAAFCAYAFFSLASVFKYPALYQEFLSVKFQRNIFELSPSVNPLYLDWATAFLGGTLLIPVLLASRHRRRALFGIILASCFLLGRQAWERYVPTMSTTDRVQKNVILIGIDSLRSDHLRKDLIPNLFQLSQDLSTVVFKDHIVGIPRTFPSWMEILEGRYSAETGIRHMFPGLLQQRGFYPGIVSELKAKGYDTAVVSDFAGDIFPRFNAGFDKIDTPNFSIQSLTKMTIDQAFPLFLPLISSKLLLSFFPEMKENPCFSDPVDLVRQAIQRMNQFEGPFFLSLFFSNAHFPYAAPWPWYSRYSDRNYEGPFFFKKDPDLAQSHSLSDPDIAQIRHLYAGSLSAIDDALKKLFQYLTDRKLWAHTTLVVTADHGEDLFEFDLVQGHGEHLRGENVLKVPLLLKLSENVKAQHKAIEFTTRMIDVAPTLAGIFGLRLSKASGLDLSPWIFGSPAAPEISAYSETEIWFSRTGNAFFQKERLDYPSIASLLTLDPGGTGSIVLNSRYERVINAAKHRSLTKGRFKLIYTPTPEGAFFRLYDRNKDPFNKTDISQQEAATFSSMKSDLLKLVAALDSDAKFYDNYVVPW